MSSRAMETVYNIDHDEVLYQLLMECKTLHNFWDTIFGFLKRRTGFFELGETPDSPGLPSNVAELMVCNTYQKWLKSCSALNKPDEISSEDLEVDSTVDIESCSDSTETLHPVIAPPLDDGSLKNTKILATSYNGAVKDNYEWTQSISDVDVTVALPLNVLSKHLNLTFGPQNILVKNMLADEVILIGDLPFKIKHIDSVWSVCSGKLEIHLEKTQERWWDRLFLGDEPIDFTKMDCSRPFHELSDEAQSKIEELKYKQDRKQADAVASIPIDRQTALKRAWYAERSPFDGPFDPSQVYFNDQ